MDPAGVLRAYAQLSGDPAPPQHDVVGSRGDWARYPFGAEAIFEGKSYDTIEPFFSLPAYERAKHMLAENAIEASAKQLRLGWLWFAGTTTDEDQTQTWCFPALSAPVARISRRFRRDKELEVVGDAEVTSLITDPELRAALFERREFGRGALREHASRTGNFTDGLEVGVSYQRIDPRVLPKLTRLNSWAAEIAEAVGIEIIETTLPDETSPRLRRSRPGIGLIVTNGLYLHRASGSETSRGTLELFAEKDGLDATAFAQLFGQAPKEQPRQYVHSFRSCSAKQVKAVESVRSSSLSLLSGAPGTGKTHLLVSAAVDAVAWGKSVLVVTGSKHATDVVVNYFADTPGPTPVVFDGSAVAKELGFQIAEQAGQTPHDISSSEAVIAKSNELDAAFDQLFKHVTTQDLATDPSHVGLGRSIDEIFALEEPLANAFGEAFTSLWLSPLDTQDRMLLREIGYSLASSKTERLESFTTADVKRLTRVAPLWVGTLEDIERILPTVPAMFDLVIIDEAANTNPIDAAGALLRANSAIICGDPSQLRQSSFLSTEEVDQAAADHGVDADRIHPRRHSLYDLTAAQASATVISEHYRSVPQLITFSARRFYGGAVDVMTSHPRNHTTSKHSASRIDVRVVEGRRESNKVNMREVDTCVEVVEAYVAAGRTSIGLVSPFRAQADAIEKALLDRFSLREIDRLGLRVGTAHGFQGDERDVMIASWAIGADESERAWQFVNQPNLFNVMVTRAREQMVVVTSCEKPPGLAGEYLTWAELETDVHSSHMDVTPWVSAVSEAFTSAGVTARTNYRVGHHYIDLVVGEGENAVAIDCGPHPDGALVHLDRGLQLRRLGWRTADAYQSLWEGNATAVAIELLGRFPDLRD